MKSKNGFTLIEVLVSMLILVIAVAGIFSVFTFTKRSTNIPGRQFQAMNLSRQQAEELRVAVQNYYYINNIGPLATGSYGPEPVNLGTLPGTRSYVVTNVDLDGDGIAESRKVTITVNWNEITP